jgi:hypothetical protein
MIHDTLKNLLSMFYLERWPMGLGPERVDRGQYLFLSDDRPLDLVFPGKFISMTPTDIDRSPWPGVNNIIIPIRRKKAPKMFFRI